jgi:hypothetical protein
MIRKTANNNYWACGLADNIKAKLIHYKQALTNILASIWVIMVHNNFEGKLVVMGQSNDYHNMLATPN